MNTKEFLAELLNQQQCAIRLRACVKDKERVKYYEGQIDVLSDVMKRVLSNHSGDLKS